MYYQEKQWKDIIVCESKFEGSREVTIHVSVKTRFSLNKLLSLIAEKVDWTPEIIYVSWSTERKITGYNRHQDIIIVWKKDGKGLKGYTKNRIVNTQDFRR